MTPQHNALFNCTNLTLEPTLGSALVKRPRLNNGEGARLKRLKYTTQEPLPEEKREAESDKEEEDRPVAFCVARRQRTFFHAKHALAMSRPGVTCRSLPCRSRFLSITVHS